MQPGHIPHEIIEAVAGGLAGRVQVNAVEPLHDVHMVRDLKVRHHRLAKALQFHVFAVVPAHGHAVVNDVGDDHHPLLDLRLELILLLLQGGQVVGQGGYLGLGGLGLFLLALGQQAADLLGKGLALVAQAVRLLAGFPVFLVQGHHLVHQGQLLILKLFADVFLDPLGVVAQQIDVQHGCVSSSMFFPVSPGKRKSPRPCLGRWTRVATRLAALRGTRPLMRRKGAPPADSSPTPGGMEPPFRPPPRTFRRLSYASKTDCFPLLRELCTVGIIHPDAAVWQALRRKTPEHPPKNSRTAIAGRNGAPPGCP